jgi:hypothetical protein
VELAAQRPVSMERRRGPGGDSDVHNVLQSTILRLIENVM